MKQCPFCLEEAGETEDDRLEHVLDKHSTRLVMAAASLHHMYEIGVGFETASGAPAPVMGYRGWVQARKRERFEKLAELPKS